MNKSKVVLHLDSSPLVLAGMEALIEESFNCIKLYQSTELSLLYSMYCQYLPDVIILDVSDVDAGLCNVLKEISLEGKASIIILTHSVSANDIVRSVNSGAKGYLLKKCSNITIRNSLVKVLMGEQCFAHEVQEVLAHKNIFEKLTSRETEILRKVALGKSNKTIAFDMSISEWTVKSHMKNILSKLRAESRTDAVYKAKEYGIISH